MERETQLRHAYLITAHSKKAQLLNLLGLLDDPENDLYLHIDKKAQGFTEAEMIAAAPHSRVSFVPRLDARWGSETFIDAILSLICLASEEEHAFYHLLSGVDLPLKPQSEIRAFFNAHMGEEFVSFERETAKPYIIEGRIARWHWRQPVHPLLKKFHRRAAPTSIFLQRVFGVNRIKNAPVVFQKGGVWFSITHALARYAVEEMPRYRAYYRHTSCAAEIWLQTLVANSPFMQRRAYMGWDDELAATMRYVDWSGGGASPRVLTSADFDMLMHSGMLFARKFDDAVDADVIKQISDCVTSVEKTT
ncbi:MAG: beta-1,6-N-acetylglucosaminyltransferase [Eubacteriales bacterium]|nr:beta-1,6-N-acetylglucosaminyltransferase [Eubacteriales bacterium]